MLFESRNNKTKDDEPLLIWLRGNIGCSSSATFGQESFPLRFRQNNTLGYQILKINPNSWTNFTNVMYLDNIVGTGYSFFRGEFANDFFTWRESSLNRVVLDFIHFMK
jgi:carboxypeptidase C (cathepsin A)